MPAWRGWSRGLKGIEEACQIVFRIIKMNRCPQVSVLFADHDVPGPELSLLFARMTTDIETNDTGPFCPRTRCADLKLAALGFLGETPPDTGWDDADPYLFDAEIAGALSRFRLSRDLSADSLLDAAATEALNVDLDSLAQRVALNLERWRHLPRDFGERHVWVNLPAYHLEVREADGSVGLEMTVNIGNAQTTGWTTPVITDSITQVVFRPAWYVPASLAASQVVPMARADSLSLYRQGFEVYQGGAAVDSRLVPWDSVSVSDFRFVQRPGPANPLGRAKFPMTNPYAILIHDTNRRDFGGPVSSGCVHAGDAEALAAYLLRAEGWEEERAQHAYRRGPQRQGVSLRDPVHTHFVYLTAEVDDTGALPTSTRTPTSAQIKR